jgi:hypothetical protein
MNLLAGAFLCVSVLIVTPCMAQTRSEQRTLGQHLVKAVKDGDTVAVKSLLQRGAATNTHETKRKLPPGTPIPTDYISEKRRLDIHLPRF